MFDHSRQKTPLPVINAKGVRADSLNAESFENLYNGMSVTSAIKTSGVKHYSKGSVTIENKNITIHHDSYVKRNKLLNKDNKWFNTNPLVLDPKSRQYSTNKVIKGNANSSFFIAFSLFFVYLIISFSWLAYILISSNDDSEKELGLNETLDLVDYKHIEKNYLLESLIDLKLNFLMSFHNPYYS